MRHLLVTHADDPIGRRIVKQLYHDERIENLLAVGQGPAPRAFDSFLAEAPARFSYARADLAKHRPVSDLFHSTRFRDADIDTVIHVPKHGAPEHEPMPLVAGVPARTSEARLILQHSLEAKSVQNLIAVGSAFVYRLLPGNSNRLIENSELNLDPEADPELRSWVDCDMIFHAEVHGERLRTVLLRVPTVVAPGGYVYLNPILSGAAGPRLRPLVFDPMCAVISDKDVAKAVQAAVHADRSGVYNVAGCETLPLSILARWTQRPSIPIPTTVLRTLAAGASFLRAHHLRPVLAGPHLRYGFTLDTELAARDLGFRPSYRIGLARDGDGRARLEAYPA